MGHLMPKFDPFVRGLFFFLFKGISTPYGLFIAKIGFFFLSLVWFICLKAYKLFMGYLMPKLD